MQILKKHIDRTKQIDTCSRSDLHLVESGLRKIAIVGNPNVGKSVLFSNLTKHYVTVSNYPGTSVEVTMGALKISGVKFEVIDTPGIYSLSPLTEEERVARRVLLHENLHLVIHVVDAKNLERMLPFTLQLIEARLPTMLVLNMMDEAEKTGVEININMLEKELGIPVMGAVAITGEGMDEIKRRIQEHGDQC